MQIHIACAGNEEWAEVICPLSLKRESLIFGRENSEKALSGILFMMTNVERVRITSMDLQRNTNAICSFEKKILCAIWSVGNSLFEN